MQTLAPKATALAQDARVHAPTRVGLDARDSSSAGLYQRLQASLARHPRVVAQARLQERMSARMQSTVNAIIQRQAPIQGKAGTGQGALPERLRSGIEALSGSDLSDVKVHTHSSKPAQLNALAFAQGSEIHLGPGQERHLAHEAWHVVQQRQGRVRPTLYTQGVAINDNPTLEREADTMGRRAAGYTLQRRACDGQGEPQDTPRCGPPTLQRMQSGDTTTSGSGGTGGGKDGKDGKDGKKGDRADPLPGLGIFTRVRRSWDAVERIIQTHTQPFTNVLNSNVNRYNDNWLMGATMYQLANTILTQLDTAWETYYDDYERGDDELMEMDLFNLSALLTEEHQAYDQVYQQARTALFNIVAFFEEYQEAFTQNGNQNYVPQHLFDTGNQIHPADMTVQQAMQQENLGINLLILEAFGRSIPRPGEGK